MYDPSLARLYVAVGSPGTVPVFDVATRVHRETIATDEGRRLFSFQPRSCGGAIFEEAA